MTQRPAFPRCYTFVSKVENEQTKGINPQFFLSHSSVAKPCVYSEKSTSPYLLANEWISAQLGQFLRLPVPPCSLMRDKATGRVLFATLQFTASPASPPDGDAAICWRKFGSLCTGIVLFDLLIVNRDRHEGNLGVDDKYQPTELLPHDHDRAVFGAKYGEGRKHIESLCHKFAIDGHCLLKHMDTATHFRGWLSRIESIPDWFIHEICLESVGPGVTKTDARAAAKVLIWRAKNAGSLVRSHHSSFPGITSWPLL